MLHTQCALTKLGMVSFRSQNVTNETWNIIMNTIVTERLILHP